MAQHSTVPRSSFSPLKQLGFEGCLLCCALYSCFGVFYGLNSLLLQLMVSISKSPGRTGASASFVRDSEVPCWTLTIISLSCPSKTSE